LITIFRLFPQALNLNGDAANALVLARRLEWLKAQVQVVDIEDEHGLQRVSHDIEATPHSTFVLAGHGSIAAMRSLESLEPKIRKLFSLAEDRGVCCIVVGSANLWTAGASVGTKARVSEFATVEINEPGWPSVALGYVNSDLDVAVLKVSKSVVSTLLHGPFLAKNPKWCDTIIARLGVEPEATTESALVDGYVDEIWRLESDN